MPATLELRLGGRIFDAFEEVTVTKSIESAASSIAVTTAPAVAQRVRLGSRVELWAFPRTPGERGVIFGWADQVRAEFGGVRTGATIAGRSAESILVDCSAIHDPGEWIDADLIAIAQELADPYGRTVMFDAEDYQRNGPFPPFPKFALEEGETVWEAIERGLRRVGGLGFPGAGGLLLTRPGVKRLNEIGGENGAYLTEGENVLSARYSHGIGGRYANYKVRGQSQGTGLRFGESAIANEGTAEDPAVRLDQLFRAGGYSRGEGPLRRRLIVADGSLRPGEAQEVAEYEASLAAARALEVTVETQDWRARTDLERSELWAPNYRVPVRLPSLGIDEEMLISSVTLRAHEREGMTSSVTLRRPDAFLAAPTIDSEHGQTEIDFESDAFREDLLS